MERNRFDEGREGTALGRAAGSPSIKEHSHKGKAFACVQVPGTDSKSRSGSGRSRCRPGPPRLQPLVPPCSAVHGCKVSCRAPASRDAAGEGPRPPFQHRYRAQTSHAIGFYSPSILIFFQVPSSPYLGNKSDHSSLGHGNAFPPRSTVTVITTASTLQTAPGSTATHQAPAMDRTRLQPIHPLQHKGKLPGS